MNGSEEILRKSWSNIKSYETGSLQLGIKHVLQWHVAYETPTNKALVIISHAPLEDIDSSKSILTVCHKRGDGDYYISFQLTEKSQEDVFISMCSNLIDYSSDALTEKDALKKVGARYRQWRRLMEHKNMSVLSDEKRRGLIGELLYLQIILETDKGAKNALEGWVGPEGADQDFVYDEIWREIKTTGLSSDQIAIHSIEQLGNGEDGELMIYRVDPCAPEADGAFTLRGLVSDISKYFDDNIELLETYFNKLSCIGYIDMDIYDKYPYKYFGKDRYDVNNSFPRLLRKEIRSEIIRCDYILSISSIDGWKRG